MGLKVIIISVEGSLRREFQEDQMSRLNLDFEFFNALTPSSIGSKKYFSSCYDWERQLKETEVSCFFSHYSVWEKISQSNEPVLVLEDDALISCSIKKISSKIKNIQNVDLLNLENRDRKKIISKKPEIIIENLRIHKLLHDTTGAAGYILWPSGAKKLLAYKKKKGVSLADAHIYSCDSLSKFQIEPSILLQLDMTPNYGLYNQYFTDFMSSTVSSKERLPSSMRFISRRIFSQLKTGIKKLYFFMFGIERYINTDSYENFQLNNYEK